MGTLNTSSALSEERGGTLELHIALFHCVLGSGLKQVVRVVAVTIQEKGGGWCSYEVAHAVVTV